MGTINYGTNKILCTIGCMNDREDFIEEQMKYYMEEEEYDEDEARDRAEDDFYDFQNDDFTSIKFLLKKEHFNYYEVELESGYYEGYYLSIKDKYIYLDNCEEKKEMQKELTRLSNFMKKIIEEYGMRVCYPWWCTGWEETLEKSLKALAQSVKAERQRIKDLKTDYTIMHKTTKEERKALLGW